MANVQLSKLESELQLIWGAYWPTRLLAFPELARLAGVAGVLVKAEWERPLGNFKSLGGMIAGLHELARAAGVDSLETLLTGKIRPATLPPLISASDGNHGLAIAAAAQRVGGRAEIYLPTSVSDVRVQRIRNMGGDVVHVAGTYDDAVAEAAKAAASGDGLLIPDTTSALDDHVVQKVMNGYAVITAEIISQLRTAKYAWPSHLFVQAGVGGLAAAMAEGLHVSMCDPRGLAIVEPESAACVAYALSAGRPERVPGSLKTIAGMLSCGVASAPAVKILRRYDAVAVPVTEQSLKSAAAAFGRVTGMYATPSGTAGLAGLLHVSTKRELRLRHRLDQSSTVLLIITEGLATGPP